MNESTQKIEHVLDPSCPWYPLKKLALPNVKWCEEQVCGWIEEPANTWSNLLYILVGLSMMKMTQEFKSRAMRFYGPAAVLVGVSSMIYHASNTFFLQIFDFFGMYVFCFLLILINLDRLGRHSFERSFLTYWLLVLNTTALTVAAYMASIPIQGIVFILILAICITEGMARRKVGKTYSLKWFWAGLGCFAVAIIFSLLDVTRTWCNPQNHWLQGHAIWHCFGALGLISSFFHHRQFDGLLASRPKSIQAT